MSTRTDVTVIPSTGDALAAQTAEFVTWERQRQADNMRFYEQYESLKKRHAELGTNWSRKFDAVEHAGYTAWQTRELGEIPLMPE